VDDMIARARKKAATGDLRAALSSVDEALGMMQQVQLFRARILQGLDRPLEALDEVARLDRGEASPKFLEFRADLEETVNRPDAAIVTIGRALAQMPDNVGLLLRLAMLQRTAGDFESARDALERAISLQPKNGELYRLLGEVQKPVKDNSILARIINARRQVPDGSMAAVHLDFARAEALDHLGQYDEAAETLVRANAAMRGHQPYDIRNRLRQVEALKHSFGAVQPAATEKGEGFAPIFVTGLPRSGTTLVEQILSAHSDVLACGETGLFGSAMTSVIGAIEDYTGTPERLTADLWKKVGEAYTTLMRNRFAAEGCVTDKSLQSLFYAGPILAALPNAQIIVVRRDPRATALSLFRQVFLMGKQLYSYDLNDIRAYQNSFDDMLAFWSNRLGDRFHVIDYEDLVTDPEPQIRTLLEMAGLPFDPACLRPEENDAPVRTLSAVSVRKPINRDALESWRPYERMLGVVEN